MKNDIIIISPFQLSMRRGVESFTYSLSNHLAEIYNLKIVIYTWSNKLPIYWGMWHKQIKIRKVPYSRYYQPLIAKIFYWFWIKLDRPDKIICNFLWHGETIVYNKNKDILIFHNPISQIPLRYKFAQKYIDYNTSIIFDSNHSLNEFRAMDVRYNNCQMIHTGVDTEYFKPSKKDDNNKLNLLCISEFEERKGIQYLIKAMPGLVKLYPSIILRIIGSGKQKNYYEQLIDQLDIRDFVDIHSSVNDTKPYLLMSDIYFLLSVGEGFPLGLLEAMSCGLPSIVSDNPPFDEIIDKSVGCRVSRKEPESLVQAVNKLRDKKTREFMGSNARDLIQKRYSWTNISKQYYNLILSQ